jgi:integrase
MAAIRPSEIQGLVQHLVSVLAPGTIGVVWVALVGQLKTKSSYRTLPLPNYVADAIAVHLSGWPADATLGGLVFTNARGAPIQESPFASAWKTACTKAGVPSWATPHDLRHYFASLLIRSGASVKVVQARLGHASAKTTLDVYGHLFGVGDQRPAQVAVCPYIS